MTGPIVVCVINLKGGVGKSTISALLARRAASSRRKRVVAIDLDPQANLSQALMGAGYANFLTNKEPSIVELFKGFIPPSGGHSAPRSAGSDLSKVIFEYGGGYLKMIPSRFDFSDNLVSAVRPDPLVLARYLALNHSDADLVLIDCAPTESILTRSAYHASGYVLVPVKPEYFATIGFPLLQESLTSFRSVNRGQVIEVAGVVVNNGFYDGGNGGGPEKARAMNEIRAEASKNGWHVFSNQIPFSRGFPKIMRGDESYSGNAREFPRFADEFFNKIGL